MHTLNYKDGVLAMLSDWEQRENLTLSWQERAAMLAQLTASYVAWGTYMDKASKDERFTSLIESMRISYDEAYATLAHKGTSSD